MKFLILCENSNGSQPYMHYRQMGAFELKRRIKKHGHEGTILEWFTHWKEEDLIRTAKTYFKDTDQPVIAVSTPFGYKDLYAIESFLSWAKKEFQNIKIIHGGNRTYQDNFKNIIDVFFLGRSMEIFDRWISNQDISKYVVNKRPLVLINQNFDEKIDQPVLPDLDEDNCFTSRDILGFEVGVGCKFNCTFCNYELRGAKITKFLDPKELHNYFDLAQKKYGITHFYTSDDTINESDEKLEVILEAIEGLDYKPKITSFARLDMFSSRKQQLDMIEKIQFAALFFGIESFNPKASKLIRKKTGLDDNFETLKEIKKRCPNTYTIGSLIAGLVGDSKEHMIQSIERVIEEKLLWGLQVYPLNIASSSAVVDDYFLSDLDKNPEKFGYKTTMPIGMLPSNKDSTVMHWESDWSDTDHANELHREINEKYADDLVLMNHFEYAGFQSLGLVKPGKKIVYNTLKHKAFGVSMQLKHQYILNKMKYLGVQ